MCLKRLPLTQSPESSSVSSHSLLYSHSLTVESFKNIYENLLYPLSKIPHWLSSRFRNFFDRMTSMHISHFIVIICLYAFSILTGGSLGEFLSSVLGTSQSN